MGCVYFVAISDESLVHPQRVKIGHTADLSRRLSSLRRGSAAVVEDIDVKLLAAVSGTRENESALHMHFVDSAIPSRRELFVMSDELSDYIRWLRDQPYTAISEFEGMTAVGFDEWRPCDGRGKAPPTIIGSRDNWFFPNPEITGDDYYTPEIVMSLVRSFMDIDLDPASHRVANRTVRAKQIYTIRDDGLLLPWFGRVWVNPPFSRYADFADKALAELERGRITEMLMLHTVRSMSTHYCQNLMQRANAQVIIRGRQLFDGIGKDKRNPDGGHGILYYGSRYCEFIEHFRNLGVTWLSSGRVEITC